jgi:hypothetical protein
MLLNRLLPFLLTAVIAYWVAMTNGQLTERLQVLEAKEDIRTLLFSYGRYVDDRNWDAFAELFASNGGTWNGGMGIATGRDEIRKMMTSTIAANNKNAAGNGYSNLHLLGNEIISVNSDSATSISKWVFVMTGDNNGPDLTFIGRYEDTFVRENGSWKFQQRIVHGDISKPTNLPGLNSNRSDKSEKTD